MSERSKNFYVSRAKDAVFHQTSQPTYEAGDHGARVFNEYRDLGLGKATGGKYFGHIVHPKLSKEVRSTLPFGGGTGPHQHIVDFQVVYIIKGWVRFEFEDNEEMVLEAGDFLYLPPAMYHGVLDYSDDLETLEIISPAEYVTNTIDKIPGKKETAAAK